MIQRHQTVASLCIVLPVHNAQGTLADRVTKLIEVACDLSVCFEIVVVDDGSDDQTEEIAVDLFRRFPQVLFARHHRRMGHEAASETGARLGTGEYVLVIANDAPISAKQIRWCWSMRENDAVETGGSRSVSGEPSLMDRLFSWAWQIAPGESSLNSTEGVRIFCRDSAASREVPPRLPSPLRRLDEKETGTHSSRYRSKILQQIRDLAVGE